MGLNGYHVKLLENWEESPSYDPNCSILREFMKGFMWETKKNRDAIVVLVQIRLWTRSKERTKSDNLMFVEVCRLGDIINMRLK